MKFDLKTFFSKPITLLILANIIIGLLIHRDFGLTWDEPLFYDYGDALGYAYSPHEWFSGHFDLYNSYGASGDDHKNRGPAYLFLARNLVYGLEWFGSDSASAWHLVNFIFFQLGIYFLYRFSMRWMNDTTAFFTAAFFAFQPLLWGHAFINPKDPPFLTFFLASICLGFEMVDGLTTNGKNSTPRILLAAFLLGVATSIRVLGPLAGVLVFIYFLFKADLKNLRNWRSFGLYGFLTIFVMFATWPFLWEDPLNFFRVFLFMSDNPTQLPVLFAGQVYRAGGLPLRYMPFMLTTTLTEPTLILFAIGVFAASWKVIRKETKYPDQLIPLGLTLLWFVLLVAYVLIRRPGMYDGIRHFLFILPPVFIFCGLGYQFLIEKLSASFNRTIWLHAGLIALILFPGIRGIIRLHPYEYAYYNSFVRGTGGAFRSYETEFWLSCYKESVEALSDSIDGPVDLYVKREAYIADYYSTAKVHVKPLRGSSNEVQAGDFILINTRTNEDISTYSNAPVVLEVKRANAVFCVIKRVP